MKCHYEILELDRDAEGSDIKTQYRKLALKWHPDKNLDDAEHAKEQFQLVQQAYEVLSDPQERAWYDKHREQILRSGDSEFEDNCLDLFQFFTTTCFKGYKDDEKGFYTVYRQVFDDILNEDMEFYEDRSEFDKIPKFGDSNSDYNETVGPFYAFWSSYNTRKSYAWLDPYNINEAKNRKYFKAIEKENKKVRSQAKKERNEEIRNLVAFVRKRDKRVQERAKQEQIKIMENRRKHEELSKLKRLELRKEMDGAVVGEWSKFDNVQSELEQIERSLVEEFGDECSNSDEEEVYDLYCVACNKSFRTTKALENHELSKKHKENVKFLKATMEEEEFNDNLSDQSEMENGSDDDEEDKLEVKKKKKNKKGRNVMSVQDEDVCDIEITANNSDDNFEFESNSKPKKKLKKQKNQNKQNEGESVQKSKKTQKKEKKSRDDNEVDTNHCCVTCKSEFPSKNKLFTHLKKTAHGVYVPKSVK